MLRQVKLALLQLADAAGINRLFLQSSWRKQRLLILCYHSSAIEDEHLWSPHLHMAPELMRQRFQALKDAKMNVLPLAEALEKLQQGTLPERSVAITFDDGTYDFYKISWPILKTFGFPVTLYYTTYYANFSRPIFDGTLSYLAWKSNVSSVDWPEIFPGTLPVQQAYLAVLNFAKSTGLTGQEKDALLGVWAGKLGFDYEEFCAKRIISIMKPEEAAELARQGLDIQLHTHRHRVSKDFQRFSKEIDDNRQQIAKATTNPAVHFCYPGGYYRPEYPEWLKAWNVTSATTCNPGMATPSSDLHLLPRLVDTTPLTAVEFRCWLSGLASFVPARPHAMSEGQLMEDWELNRVVDAPPQGN